MKREMRGKPRDFMLNSRKSPVFHHLYDNLSKNRWSFKEPLTVGRRYMHISDYESHLDDQDRHIQFYGTHFSIKFAATYRIPTISCLTRPQALREAKKLSLYLLGNEPESNSIMLR